MQAATIALAPLLMLRRGPFSLQMRLTTAARPRLKPTSTQPLHRPEGVHHVVERSARGHRIGVPHQRLEVAGSANLLSISKYAGAPPAHGTLRCRMTSVAEF
jgi:hypothetical protein